MAITENIHSSRTTGLSGDAGEQFCLGVLRLSSSKVRISAWQPGEKHCQLCLYKNGKIYKKMPMTAMKAEGMEDIFTIVLLGERLDEQLSEMEYDFWVNGEHRMDPYARMIKGREKFGRKGGASFLIILTGRASTGSGWMFPI